MVVQFHQQSMKAIGLRINSRLVALLAFSAIFGGNGGEANAATPAPTAIQQAADSSSPAQQSKAILSDVEKLLQQGKQQFLANQLLAARQTFEHGLTLSQKTSDPLGQATVLNQLGEVYTNLRQFDLAQQSLQQALILWRKLGDRAGEAAALIRWAEFMQAHNQPTEATQPLQQALAIYQQLSDRLGVAETWLELGSLSLAQSKPADALQQFEQGLAALQSTGNAPAAVAQRRLLQGRLQAGIGQAQLSQQPEASLQSLQQALTLQRETGDRRFEGTTLFVIGLLKANQQQLEEALQFYQQALVIFEPSGDRSSTATLQKYMGVAYFQLKRYPQALTVFQQSFSAYQEIGDRTEQIQVLINLGEIYTKQKQTTQAVSIYQQLIALAKDSRDSPTEMKGLDKLGHFYQDQGFALRNEGKYAEAIVAFQRSLEMFQQSYRLAQQANDRKAEAWALSAIGGAYLAQGQTQMMAGAYPEALTHLQRAIASLQQALILAQALKNADLANVVIFRLSLVYSGQSTGFAQLRQNAEALEAGQQALAVVRQNRDRLKPQEALALEAGALKGLGLRYQDLGQPQQAADVYQEALKVQQQLGSDPEEEVGLLSSLSTLYDTLSQYPKALQTAQQALTLVRQKLKDPRTESLLLTAIGNYLQAMGKYAESIQHHQQALAIAKQIGDRRLESVAINNLGNTYDEQGQYKQSLEYRHQAFDAADEALRRVEAGDPAAQQQFCAQASSTLSSGYSRDLCLNMSRSAKGTTLNNLGGSYAKLGRYGEALKLRQEALKLVKPLGERDGEATLLNNLGFIYLQTGEYAKALTHFERALDLTIAVGNRAAQSRTLSNMGMVYGEQGQYDKSLEYRQKALAIAQQLNSPSLQVNLFDNIGTVYGYLGDHRQALDYFQRSLKLSETLGIKPTTQLGNLGFFYESAGDFSKAREYYQQVLTLAQENDDRQNEATALSKLANVDWSQGYYAVSLQKRQQAQKIYQDMGDRPNEAMMFAWLGRSYRILGQHDRALEALQKALTLGRDMGIRRIEANVLSQMGTIYQEQQKYTEALEKHRQALAIQTDIKESVSMSRTLTSIGTALVQQGKPTDAIANFQKALQIQQSTGVHPDEAVTLRELGLAYAAQGKLPQAIKTLQQAAIIHHTVNDREQEGITLSELGNLLLANQQLEAAETALSNAIQIFEKQRVGLSDRDNVALFETQLKTYQRLQEVLIKLNRFSLALEVAERGRARAFIELLAKRVSTTQLIDQAAAPITLEQIKGIAKSHQATLVEYTVLPHAVYIWVIKPTGEIAFRQTTLNPSPGLTASAQTPTTAVTRGERIPTKSVLNLTTLVTQTRDAISARTRSGTTVPEKLDTTQQTFQLSLVDMHSQLQSMHQLLIEPIADLLPQDPHDRVIFIPHGALFLVPFAALRNGQGKYLIDQHTILTVPSIQVLNLTQQEQNQGNQQPSTTSTSLIVGAPSPMPEGLQPLEGMKLEATEIAKLLNSHALIGQQATKAAIVPQMQQARLIHLATHGLFDDVDGIGSKIALASSNPDDGFLTAEEILNLKLQANLVVLSACNTGRGKITGDGVIGLSRSLISAGVPSVVVSLWSVFDSSTSVLMTEFYRNWHERKLDKAQALRQAMLSLKKENDDPIEWAAFTLIGEP